MDASSFAVGYVIGQSGDAPCNCICPTVNTVYPTTCNVPMLMTGSAGVVIGLLIALTIWFLFKGGD